MLLRAVGGSRLRSAGTMASSVGRIKAAMVDLSGTLHIEDTAIPGAQDALQRLRDAGLELKFVTNTTKEPLRLLHARLETLGFVVAQSEVFTSLTAARRLVEESGVRPLLMLEESAKEDFAGIPQENPNAVVVGLAPECFNYAPMNDAFRLLLDGGQLIAIHRARYFKKKDGLYLGPGPFVVALEYATDRAAVAVGKPERTFFAEAMRGFSCEPREIVMIGDDARDDVGGAMQAGMQGILVQTGKYRQGDEKKIEPGPTAVCADFPSAVQLILEQLDS